MSDDSYPIPPYLGEGESVRLRHWRAEDVAPYREWLRPHQEWHQWDGPYFERPSAEVCDGIAERLRRIVAEEQGVWWAASDPEHVLPVARVVVADAASDELVGTVSWSWESVETEWARMGITIYEPGLRGSGRGTEALQLWTSYLFRTTDWRRLDYATWSGNIPMMRVGQKLGFREEGRFREARVVRGEIFDSVVMGVLRSEWKYD